MLLSKLLFLIGAVIMVVIGSIFGITDYYVISILVCLIICPISSNITLLSSVFTTKSKVLRVINATAFIGSLYITHIIFQHYSIYNWNMENTENTMIIFNKCVEDLNGLVFALKTFYNVNIDYYELNVWIYMVIYSIIILYPILLLVGRRVLKRISKTK